MSILAASIGAQASVSPPGKSYIMTSSQQEMLRKAWLEGRHGNLCARSEAMLWAVREVWRAEKRSLHGLQTFAAGLVTKVGTGEHPTQRAVGIFYARVDVASSSSPSSCLRLSFVIVLFAIRIAIARHTFVEHRCTMSTV